MSPKNMQGSEDVENSQSVSDKKYAVVSFSDDSCEVVPTNWFINKMTTRWPSDVSEASLRKYLVECPSPSSNWATVTMKPYLFTNSLKKAMSKAEEAKYTSNFSSESSDEVVSVRRKVKKPARFQNDSESIKRKHNDILNSGESSDTDCELFLDKSYQMPDLPTDGAGASSSKGLKKFRQTISTDSQALGASSSKGLKKSRPSISTDSQQQNSVIVSTSFNSQDEIIPTSFSEKMFKTLEEFGKTIRKLEKTVEELNVKVGKIIVGGSPGIQFTIDCLPEDINLPLKSDAELGQFNQRIREDREFASTLVRFLYNSASGKSERSYILSITKKILAQEVAVTYSRFGRKGKKAFVKYQDTLNVILAAGTMKYKNADREDLAENFGKALACASDWDRRKPRPSDRPSDHLMADTNSLNFSDS